MKVYRSKKEIKVLIEAMCDWIIEKNEQGEKASGILVSREFNIPKTTFQRWFDTYMEEISLKKYHQVNAIFEKNNKKNQVKRDEMRQRTLDLAEAILDPKNKEIPLYKIIQSIGVDRKRAMNLIYYQLKDLDKSIDKSYYLKVLKQIRHNTNHASKVNALIENTENELLAKKYLNIEPGAYANIETKILKSASLYLSDTTIEEVAEIYHTTVSNLVLSYEEVLPNIDLQIADAVLRKLNKESKINYKQR